MHLEADEAGVFKDLRVHPVRRADLHFRLPLWGTCSVPGPGGPVLRDFTATSIEEAKVPSSGVVGTVSRVAGRITELSQEPRHLALSLRRDEGAHAHLGWCP